MVVLLVPTMIWVRLRVPRMSRLVEFLCLLPLTIPALVIVVGISGVYAWVNYLIGDSALTLTFAYVVLVLPYAYRSIDSALSAIDVVTLAEAARSLGASWLTVIARIVLPNIMTGVLSAAFISVALVLGEFTFASLLHFDTMPVALVADLQDRRPGVRRRRAGLDHPHLAAADAALPAPPRPRHPDPRTGIMTTAPRPPALAPRRPAAASPSSSPT